MQRHAKPRAGLGKSLSGALVMFGQELAVQGDEGMPGIAQAQERCQTVGPAAHGHGQGRAPPGHFLGPQSPVSAARTYLRKA